MEFELFVVRLTPLHDRSSDLIIRGRPPLEPNHHPGITDLVHYIAPNRSVILFLGGHPIKLGLHRYVVDLIERGLVSHVATNGSGIIHDFELAAFGETSEDVAKWIQAGQFGLWRETSRLNDIISEGAKRGEGLGQAVGRVIEDECMPHRDISIAAAGYRCGVPVTCHVTIGADIIHSHPNCDGAALGATSYKDFLTFAQSILSFAHEPIGDRPLPDWQYPHQPNPPIPNERWRAAHQSSVPSSDDAFSHKRAGQAQRLTELPPADVLNRKSAIENPKSSGTFLNIGSAVTGPEVYLKALAMARNIAHQRGQEIRRFVTGVFDLVPLPDNPQDGAAAKDDYRYYYRPWKTILVRTVADGGRSFYICGDHRQTIPALWTALRQRMESTPANKKPAGTSEVQRGSERTAAAS
jgi:hypothetical protein